MICETGKLFVSRDMVFSKDTFPFIEISPPLSNVELEEEIKVNI